MSSLSTVVWNETTQYTFPIRNATISGLTVTVKQINHRLSDGDFVTIFGSSIYSSLFVSTTISVVDRNTFTYQLSIPSSLNSISPTPGQKNEIWLQCKKYSVPLVYPKMIQLQVDSGVEVGIQTFENGEWTQQANITSSDLLTTVIFDALWKDVRLVLLSGSIIPTVELFQTGSAPTNNPSTTVYLPKNLAASLSAAIDVHDGKVYMGGDVLPVANQNLGTDSAIWRQVSAQNLNLNNGIGNFTFVGDADNLYLYNNLNGKTYTFNLTEVTDNVPPKAE